MQSLNNEPRSPFTDSIGALPVPEALINLQGGQYTSHYPDGEKYGVMPSTHNGILGKLYSFRLHECDQGQRESVLWYDERGEQVPSQMC